MSAGYWRNLGELEDTPESRAFREREFPEGASEPPDAVSRRTLLQLLGASVGAAGLAACRRPEEHIVPYVAAPEQIVPGVPRYYATTMPNGTSAYGLVVERHEGRPTKLDGNELHPASLGSSSARVQATGDAMSRLWAVEALLSITGASADHRLRLPAFVAALAASLRDHGLAIDAPAAPEVKGMARPGCAPWPRTCSRTAAPRWSWRGRGGRAQCRARQRLGHGPRRSSPCRACSARTRPTSTPAWAVASSRTATRRPPASRPARPRRSASATCSTSRARSRRRAPATGHPALAKAEPAGGAKDQGHA
jgi:MoCo/4Fe-4S cofactor protein with predicted Tat translocation signal